MFYFINVMDAILVQIAISQMQFTSGGSRGEARSGGSNPHFWRRSMRLNGEFLLEPPLSPVENGWIHRCLHLLKKS